MDHVDKAKRSEIMASVKGKDTSPELLVRKELHRRGFRYRLYPKDIPGKPDLVFPKFNAIIFIHGCFWHGHNCEKGKLPKSNLSFWEEKIVKNKQRDRKNVVKLKKEGYKILTIWQCKIIGKRKMPIKILGDKVESWLLSLV